MIFQLIRPEPLRARSFVQPGGGPAGARESSARDSFMKGLQVSPRVE
jgi:hypothetical protein